MASPPRRFARLYRAVVGTSIGLATLWGVELAPLYDRRWHTVIDRGPGISEEDQQKLFRKHTRLSARPTAGESSVGLGLSIVKKLAEAMGGEVRCKSTLGAGSSFILRLRAVPAELLAVSPR